MIISINPRYKLMNKKIKNKGEKKKNYRSKELKNKINYQKNKGWILNNDLFILIINIIDSKY
jgi:hypothetical protein